MADYLRAKSRLSSGVGTAYTHCGRSTPPLDLSCKIRRRFSPHSRDVHTGESVKRRFGRRVRQPHEIKGWSQERLAAEAQLRTVTVVRTGYVGYSWQVQETKR